MKLLASDFDGTLYFHNKEEKIRESDLESIRKFQKEGNLFGICTGRHLKGILEPTKEKVDFDFYIVNSGAVILDKNREVIQEYKIERQVAEEVTKYIDKSVEVTFIIDDEFYAINWKGNWPIKVIEVSSIKEVDVEYLDALSFHFEDLDQATEIYNHIVNKYSYIIDVYQNITNLDFAPKGCSKGNALKKVMDYYKVNCDDMNCIGDSWNDLPMFEAVDNSFTFTYSPKDIQQSTKHVIDSLEECISIIMS